MLEKVNYRKAFIFVLIVITLFGWLLSLRLNTINLPFERDEGEYAYSAYIFRNGGVPYKEAFMQKPPMIIYTYMLAQLISHEVWAPRILAFISIFLTGLILMAILHKEYDIKIAILTPFIFFLMLSFLPLHSFAANTEVFLILPLVISWYFYFKFKRNNNFLYLVAMGVFSAVAVMYKPIALPPVVLLAVLLLVEDFFRKKNIYYLLSIFLFFTISFAATILVIILPILIRGGGLFLWEVVFLYNRYYASSSFFVRSSLPLFFVMLLYLWPLIFFVMWIFKKHSNHWLFLSGLLASCLVGAFGGSLGHYYIILIPIAAIIYAVVITELAGKFLHLDKKLMLFASLAFSTLIYPLAYTVAPSHQLAKILFGPNPFRESIIIARELKKITLAKDTVFIAGSEPQILYYANRKSATRFVITYPLTIPTPLAKSYEEEVLTSLKYKSPKAIIIVSYSGSGFTYPNPPQKLRKYINNLINLDYELVGATVYDENKDNFYFLPKLNQEELNKATLLLYKKKPTAL